MVFSKQGGWFFNVHIGGQFNSKDKVVKQSSNMSCYNHTEQYECAIRKSNSIRVVMSK